jgi:hypothetical protein
MIVVVVAQIRIQVAVMMVVGIMVVPEVLLVDLEEIVDFMRLDKVGTTALRQWYTTVQDRLLLGAVAPPFRGTRMILVSPVEILVE